MEQKYTSKTVILYKYLTTVTSNTNPLTCLHWLLLLNHSRDMLCYTYKLVTSCNENAQKLYKYNTSQDQEGSVCGLNIKESLCNSWTTSPLIAILLQMKHANTNKAIHADKPDHLYLWHQKKIQIQIVVPYMCCGIQMQYIKSVK